MEPKTQIGSIPDPVARLLAFIKERHLIYLRRKMGQPAPWTDDPILREWKFCNVYRELDRVSLWLTEHWYNKHQDDKYLWFAAVVARFVNWPDTLEELGWPVPWDPKRFLAVMAGRKERKEKRYTGAYMIRAKSNGPGKDKAEYQVEEVFSPIWSQRELMRPFLNDTLNSYHMSLGFHHGFGSFLAAQVCADLKHYGRLKSASDWWTFAASGPGSRRGLNRVLGRSVKAPWTEEEWRFRNEDLRQILNVHLEKWGMAPLDGMNANNISCEFDKMERVRLGEGRPRSRFKPYTGG